MEKTNKKYGKNPWEPTVGPGTLGPLGAIGHLDPLALGANWPLGPKAHGPTYKKPIKTCKKLKLVGVGYKVFEIAHSNYKLLHFKLGYSHNIYYRIPDNVEIVVSQSTKIFISSYDYTLVSAVSSIIKNYKYPEPYKGKGILYFNESIKLKEGKKI